MNLNRRKFLKTGSALSVATAHPLALSLAGLGNAAAQAAGTAGDYKAIVCVFLNGGNDHSNTVVPYDAASYDTYARLRPDLAYAKETLTMGVNGATVIPIAFKGSDGSAGAPMTDIAPLKNLVLGPKTALPGGRQFALAPPLTPLMQKFNDGRMAVLLNVGTLVKPIAKASYVPKSLDVPPRLFSHNDQAAYWQSLGVEGQTVGWGGTVEDELLHLNGYAPMSCVSVGGNTVFLSGREAIQYQVVSSGPIEPKPLLEPLFRKSTACSDALRQIMIGGGTHMFEREYSRITERGLEAASRVNAATSPHADLFADAKYDVLRNDATAAHGNELGRQLGMVAKMIAARNELGAARQVFYVSVSGWDMHSDLPRSHPALLREMADALSAFDDLLTQLNLSESVTTFTASEFGRALTSNGGGSDHGWGGMQFVLGGAVNGGDFYGDAPVIADNGPDDVGSGRLLPTMAVEQVAATLARWMGVADDTSLLRLFPNLQNFASTRLGSNVGFMKLV